MYLGELVSRVTESNLKENFYAYGGIEYIIPVFKRECTFFTYTTKEEPKKATYNLSNKIVIKGLRLNLL